VRLGGGENILNIKYLTNVKTLGDFFPLPRPSLVADLMWNIYNLNSATF